MGSWRRAARRCTPLAAVLGCNFGAAGGGNGVGFSEDAGTSSSGDVAPGSGTLGDDTGVVDGGATGASSSFASSTGDSIASGSDATSTADDTTDDGSSSTGTPARCDQALLVTGDTNVAANGDAPIYDRLLALGYDVTVVQSDLSQTEDVGDNCLVLLSGLGSSTAINTKFRDVPVGVVVLEPGLFDDMALVASGADAGWVGPVDDVEIIDPAHSLAAGLDGVVPIYSGGGVVSWGLPLADAQVAAIWPRDSTRATIFGYEPGDDLAGGLLAPARRVAFQGATTGAATTPARVDLFEAAVLWAVGELP